MPTPEFRWREYRVPPAATDVLSEISWSPQDALAREAAAGTVQLPDLHEYPTPSDKAKILLESAAEIEHALMVQYLYAAYSLKSSSEVDPPHRAVLNDQAANSWPRTLLDVASEEMGHLMTAQNLLLLLGLPPNLEREDFPPRKDLYPFPLHLEPLTRHSLAKYVVAEAPPQAPDIDDIVAEAQGAGVPFTNRVGVLYGLLGVVFATQEQVDTDRDSDDAWDRMVSGLARVAYQQAPPQAWHLPDGCFTPTDRQAEPSDWGVDGVRVHQATDRDTARSAIRDIGQQGEGPTTAGEQSHFERLRLVYRGRDGRPGFPASDWIPARNVPTNPRAEAVTDARTRRWMELADLRYALLLGLVEHYLVAATADRPLLTAWIFSEMRTRLGFLARKLTTMPTGTSDAGVAGMPFTLPDPIHLPGTEPERWRVHGQRVQAAIQKTTELQATDADDAADRYLGALLASDRSRLVFIADRVTPPATTPPTTTSFVRDIAPLFRPVDVEHMSEFDLDLSDYEAVRDAASTILARLRGSGGSVMPPRPHRRWTAAQVALFDRWITEGHPA